MVNNNTTTSDLGLLRSTDTSKQSKPLPSVPSPDAKKHT